MNEDEMVSVCAECLARSCLLGRFQCENRTGKTVVKSRGELLALKRELKSWLRATTGDADQAPQTEEDVRELAEWAREQEGYTAPIFASYLIGECGLDHALCKRATWEVWPAVADEIARWEPS